MRNKTETTKQKQIWRDLVINKIRLLSAKETKLPLFVEEQENIRYSKLNEKTAPTWGDLKNKCILARNENSDRVWKQKAVVVSGVN